MAKIPLLIHRSSDGYRCQITGKEEISASGATQADAAHSCLEVLLASLKKEATQHLRKNPKDPQRAFEIEVSVPEL